METRQTLSSNLAGHINEILDELGLDYTEYGERVSLPCPAHGGSRENCSIYPSGKWVCFSHHCEEENWGLLGFIQAVLGKDFKEAVKWAKNFLEGKPQTTVRSIWSEREKKSLPYSVTRSQIQELLEIPSPYYLNRGFSPSALAAFDVGTCRRSGRGMTGRVVVPVYSPNGEFVGCQGRTLTPLCGKCGHHHYGNCFGLTTPKWKNCDYFYPGDHLYNVASLRDVESVVIVEGPSEVWRLWEAGIKNSVAVFTNSITDTQRDLLFSSPIRSVFLAFDNDSAGEDGREVVRRKLSPYYTIHDVKIPTKSKDIGEMCLEDVQQEILPQVQ